MCFGGNWLRARRLWRCYVLMAQQANLWWPEKTWPEQLDSNAAVVQGLLVASQGCLKAYRALTGRVFATN